MSVSYGRYCTAPFFIASSSLEKPGSSASSPVADPSEPQTQACLCGSATSSPWCHPPPFLGNSPSSCLLSCAVPSQSSHIESSQFKVRHPLSDPKFYLVGCIPHCQVLSSTCPVFKASASLLSEPAQWPHINHWLALFSCECWSRRRLHQTEPITLYDLWGNTKVTVR